MQITDQDLARATKRIREKAPQSPCPNDIKLAAFIDNNLAEPEKTQIIGHIVQCETCREIIMVARQEIEAEKAKTALAAAS